MLNSCDEDFKAKLREKEAQVGKLKQEFLVKKTELNEAEILKSLSDNSKASPEVLKQEIERRKKLIDTQSVSLDKEKVEVTKEHDTNRELIIREKQELEKQEERITSVDRELKERRLLIEHKQAELKALEAAVLERATTQ